MIETGLYWLEMVDDLFYPLDEARVGLAVVINNLDREQVATRRDVQAMTTVLMDIGRQIYRSY